MKVRGEKGIPGEGTTYYIMRNDLLQLDKNKCAIIKTFYVVTITITSIQKSNSPRCCYN